MLVTSVSLKRIHICNCIQSFLMKQTLYKDLKFLRVQWYGPLYKDVSKKWESVECSVHFSRGPWLDYVLLFLVSFMILGCRPLKWKKAQLAQYRVWNLSCQWSHAALISFDQHFFFSSIKSSFWSTYYKRLFSRYLWSYAHI